eukprot:TRINITY_DN5445_c0_g1_i1.p1 TRINITY_DN5445_c0_g1~~TRINITY_DN5445_c0_g1_i1.p1  ORF type:complete len:177 (-),score=38.64 TRINITY_DN5445_c0_g1_i1:62-592(-)
MLKTVTHDLTQQYERENMAEDEWMSEEMQENVFGRVESEVKEVLFEHTIIGHRKLYGSVHGFLESMGRFGGVIEASPLLVQSSPSVNVMIEPNGEMFVQSTHEQYFGAPYCFQGATFPQSVVPADLLADVALNIATCCYQHGVIGCIGIDFVTFWDEDSESQQLWAVDLNVRPTTT